jgi:hypothetical protein
MNGGRMCRADHACLVDFELANAKVPILIGRDAGCVTRIGELVTIGPDEPDFRRVASARRSRQGKKRGDRK